MALPRKNKSVANPGFVLVRGGGEESSKLFWYFDDGVQRPKYRPGPGPTSGQSETYLVTLWYKSGVRYLTSCNSVYKYQLSLLLCDTCNSMSCNNVYNDQLFFQEVLTNITPSVVVQHGQPVEGSLVGQTFYHQRIKYGGRLCFHRGLSLQGRGGLHSFIRQNMAPCLHHCRINWEEALSAEAVQLSTKFSVIRWRFRENMEGWYPSMG